jgi:uncharacterized SAM-binding protein YcdF (DUF218 family)
MLLCTLLLYALSLKPVANLVMYPLEARYASPPEGSLSLDLVAVLGGGMYPCGGLRPVAELREHSYSRFRRGVEVFKASGAGTLIFSGGNPDGGCEAEAALMKQMAISLGIPAETIIAETGSRNTKENAAAVARLLPPGQDRRIGLVTSAVHMPRSVAVFRAHFPDDTIIPVPALSMYYPMGWDIRAVIPSVCNLEQSTVALHEWIGMAWYAVRYR